MDQDNKKMKLKEKKDDVNIQYKFYLTMFNDLTKLFFYLI